MKTIIVSILLFCGTYVFSQSISDSVINNMGKIEAEFVYDENSLVQIPNTNIKIQAPEYFLISESIPGLLHPGSSATVQVQEIKGTSYIMIGQAMTPEHFLSQGVNLISTSEVVMQNGKGGILYLVEFEASGITYERLMLFAGDYNNTIWINANYPKSAKKLLQNILTQSLLTAQFIK